jgi:hypothetical protein
MEHSGPGSVEWRVKTKLWILLGWLALAQNLSAAGLIIIHEQDFWRLPPPPFRPPEPIPPVPPYPHPPPRPPVWAPPVWAPLEMNYTKAEVRIRDQIATTVVEQEFYNPNARQLGHVPLPHPQWAQVNKFTMEINGKPVEGEPWPQTRPKGSTRCAPIARPGLAGYRARLVQGAHLPDRAQRPQTHHPSPIPNRRAPTAGW